jgi:hypothetical protein
MINMKILDVTSGMTVFGKDRVELGTVKEVWAETEGHGLLPVSRHLIEDYGPIKGTSHLRTIDRGYLQVRQGDSLGFGGRDLWVPLHIVERVDSQSGATISLTSEHCETTLIDRPELLPQAA